jgi:hypothetical protein
MLFTTGIRDVDFYANSNRWYVQCVFQTLDELEFAIEFITNRLVAVDVNIKDVRWSAYPEPFKTTLVAEFYADTRRSVVYEQFYLSKVK